MLKTRLHQSPCNGGPPMTPNQLRFRASSQKGSTDHKLYRLHPGLQMTSRIKHLQLAKLYPSIHVANTKSMTPNQQRLRAPGFKGFRHTPLGLCSGFKAKVYDFIFLFLLFFFFFFSFLEDNIGLQLLVTQTYSRLSTCLRPVLQSGREHTNLQPIETI